MKTLVVEVTRKGGKRDAVNIAKFAELYLLNYLEIREQRYKPEKNNKAFFLSIYRGKLLGLMDQALKSWSLNTRKPLK